MPIPAQANQSAHSLLPIVMLGVVAVMLVFLLIFARYFSLWLQCFLTRAGISFVNLVAMSVRKVNPRVIVESKIMSVQSGVAHEQNITTRALESHYLAGGNVRRVVEALIAARSRGVDLTFKEAAAIDLAGKDPLEAVNSGAWRSQVLMTESVIHPAGTILADGNATPAVSDGDPIAAGHRVEVVDVHGDILVVRPSDSR